LAFGAAALLVMIGAVLAWAWFSTGRSTIARALIWMEADIGDQHRFPARSIPARRQASSLLGGPEADLRAPARGADGDGAALDRLLRDTETRAFVVVHRDRVVYERYFGGSGRDELETSFSVAKSFLSTLVGIAHRSRADRRCRRAGDRLPPAAGGTRSALPANHAARPADHVLGPAL
jgi:CubicO group peptidase (beta-lactamase class C family)